MPVRLWRTPLDTEKVKLPKAEIHIIKDQCKGCGFCIQFCPKKVLEESEEINARGVHLLRLLMKTSVLSAVFALQFVQILQFSFLKNHAKRDARYG